MKFILYQKKKPHKTHYSAVLFLLNCLQTQ